MRWTALNGIGAVFWVLGLSLAVDVSHSATWGSAVWPTVLPAHSFYIGGVFGLLGLATLLWANLVDA